MRRTWIFITLLRLSLFPVMMVAAGDFEIRRRHGNGLLGRAGAVPMTVEKRFDGSRFTFYDAGLGACGITNTNADFIVALNANQWNTGGTTANCFKTITITANGKTASAQITDLCPGCPYGGLDFSRGLFDHFADESVGVLTGSWDFGGSTPTTSTTPYTPPTTSTTYYNANPTPTTTTPVYNYNTSPVNSPSSSHSPSPSSLSSFSSHSSASSAFSPLSSSTSSAPGATASNTTIVGVLEGMNLAFVNMGAVFVSGNKVDR